MNTNPSTVYRWVVAAMDRITAEPAKRVLELELRRLDQVQTAIYGEALQGDLSSQQMCLRIADQRARHARAVSKGAAGTFQCQRWQGSAGSDADRGTTVAIAALSGPRISRSAALLSVSPRRFPLGHKRPSK